MPWTPSSFTARGIPKIVDGDVMPGFKVGYNAQSTALDTALDDVVTAEQDNDSVATIAAIPVTGNWPGRVLYCEEDDMLRVWDGAGWITYGGRTPYFFGSRTASALGSTGSGNQAWVTSTDLARGISMSSGVLTFTTPGIYQIHQLVDWNTINLSGQRNLGIGTTGTILGPIRSAWQPSSIANMSQDHTGCVHVNAGDTATPFVAHNSGASLTIAGQISVTWIEAI